LDFVIYHFKATVKRSEMSYLVNRYMEKLAYGSTKEAALSVPVLLRAGLGAAGLGAVGYGAFRGGRLNAARELYMGMMGKEYKPNSWVQRHPYLSGALTAGLAPYISLRRGIREHALEIPEARKAYAKHPFLLKM